MQVRLTGGGVEGVEGGVGMAQPCCRYARPAAVQGSNLSVDSIAWVHCVVLYIVPTNHYLGSDFARSAVATPGPASVPLDSGVRA